MNTASKQPKEATARTTTIRIIPPSNYEVLAKQFRLVRYSLPDTLTRSRDKDLFARVHNELKETLEVPYKVYTFDKYGTAKWAVYVLYPAIEDETEAACPEVHIEGEPLPAHEVKFTDPKLEFHILVKLLQIAYFRQQDSNNKHRFIGLDKCFVYAKRRSLTSDKYHICLEITLKGDIDDIHVFSVIGQAKTFAKEGKINPNYIHRNTYYSLIDIRDQMIMFSQVKRSQVLTTQPLYVQRTFQGSRTTLDYHSSKDDEAEQTRGYLVDTFIKGFSQYLLQYDFQIEHISRKFKELQLGEFSDFELPIHSLKTVYINDQRFNQEYPLSEYIDALKAKFPALNFEVIDNITAGCPNSVLIFEDCEGKAFEEGMPLFGETDPHPLIYAAFPWVAKQFINVNDNVPYEGGTREEYLDYESRPLEVRDLVVSMNELFLKDVILRNEDAQSRLPMSPSDLIFIHRENRGRFEKKQEYEVALYFEEGIPRFLDLRSNDDREQFYELATKFGVDEVYDQIRLKRGNQTEERNTYDLIIGDGICAEIVDANEAVMYDYDKLIQRIEAARSPLELDELKLAHRYDEIIEDPKLSKQWLAMKGLTQTPPVNKPKTGQDQDALELYHALNDYDAYLDAMKQRYDSISFRELLIQEEEKIAELFGSTRKLHNIYKKLHMFEALRGADVVPVYQGIWYTDDLRYVIGDTNPMNDTLARALRIRQFKFHAGEFDISSMLHAMSVQFVRLKQYTVRPYYFHLIDMYIDNILQHTRYSSSVNVN